MTRVQGPPPDQRLYCLPSSQAHFSRIVDSKQVHPNPIVRYGDFVRGDADSILSRLRIDSVLNVLSKHA